MRFATTYAKGYKSHTRIVTTTTQLDKRGCMINLSKLKKVNGQDLTTIYRKLPPRDKDGGSQLEQQLLWATTMSNTVAGQ